MKPPQVVLFNADGVIQRWSTALRPTLARMIPCPEDVDAFIRDLSLAEGPCLDGSADPGAALSPVLHRWHSNVTIATLLEAFTLIEPDREILNTVNIIRREGFICGLATNQQCHRAAYMSGKPGYGALFDREFYSCHLGVKKPDTAYFHALLDRLHQPATAVLFIDDREANVAGAKAAGLMAVRFHIDSGATAPSA